jgi:hypothetical protein
MRALARRPSLTVPARAPVRASAIAPARSCSNQLLQAKLKVGPVDDPFEREADAVANRMMRAPEAVIRRKCVACAQEEHDQVIRLKAAGSDCGVADAAVTGLGPGQPLPAAERAFFEPRLGRDLAGVRVHRDAPAAPGLGARAFTLDREIAFAPGEWRPGTVEGRRLLAHELVHVLQQERAPERVVRRQAAIDARAQALIDLAQDTSRALPWRAHELLWRMLSTYFPGEVDKVAGTAFEDSEPGLSTTYRGPAATRVGIITIGRNFVAGTTARGIARRVAQLAHELQHIDQQRAGMAGANRSDEREFLAFVGEAGFVERPGTGTMPHAMRVSLIDAALGYYNCLSAELQRRYASEQRQLLSLRATHDGQAGNPRTTPPTACRRQG